MNFGLRKAVYAFFLCVLVCLAIQANSFTSRNGAQNPSGVYAQSLKAPEGRAIAAFSEGCFWHAEIIFESLKGVDSVVSGYAGGFKRNPTYQEVCSDQTGHAETVLVYYDPKIINFEQLLNAFFLSHDPTQYNKQEPDIGPQYRSIAFYSTPVEKKAIQDMIASLQKARTDKKKIETSVGRLNVFYKAEPYHQHYIQHHPENRYVQTVSIPEYKEFRKVYKGELKPDEIQ